MKEHCSNKSYYINLNHWFVRQLPFVSSIERIPTAKTDLVDYIAGKNKPSLQSMPKLERWPAIFKPAVLA